jgi:hypothetical protein
MIGLALAVLGPLMPGWVLKAAGSPFLRGLVVSVLVAMAIGAAYLWAYGNGKAACRTAQLEATIADMTRQAQANADIRRRAEQRAAAANLRNRQLQENIDATPANAAACLDADAAGRVRDIR